MIDERLKYTANLCNGLALGFGGFAVIRPLTTAEPILWLYVPVAFALHVFGHYLLGIMTEDTP